MTFKRTCSALALVIALSVANTAAAAPPSPTERCAQVETQMRRFIRTIQSSSDALFERGDVQEAEALRKASDAFYEPSRAFVLDLSKPGSTLVNNRCVQNRIVPLLDAYTDAVLWASSYLEVRRTGASKRPFGPLVVHPPAP